jgi:uncharacterized repeat protein (TIGR01451 family)
MAKFSQKNNSKILAGLIAGCVLISIFIPLSEVNASYPPLNIVKTVDKRFPSLGGEIVYTLAYKNNTSQEITGIIIKDPFTNQNQNYLSFVSASPSPASGNDTWTIASLGPNQSGQITIRARVSGSIPGWASEIKNRATIESDQTSLRRSNNASVFITVRSFSGSGDDLYTGGTTSSSKLSIDKLARNVTRGSTYTYWTNWTSTVYAEPGDEIEFLIKIKGPRDKEIDSVRVNDKLPPKLTYISDSTTVDDLYEPDGIISKYIYIGDVYPYLYREITFKAKIASVKSFNLYPISLVNTVSVWGSDGEKIEDSAKIIVREPTAPIVKGVMISPGQPLSISKLGRNLSQGRTNWLSSFSAKPGEEVEFSIQVVNTGDNDLDNVKVWDTLPASLLIIKNSTTINGVGWGGDVAGSGLGLGTLYQGEAKTIKFRARIDSADKFSSGSTTLINTAYVSADNVSQISDQGSVNVNKTGVVKGAVDIKVGANLIGLIILIIISCFIAFVVYCRLREDRLLEVLNNDKASKFYKSLIRFYFRLKFFFRVKAMRFKKAYW